MAIRLEEDHGRPRALFRDMSSGELQWISADTILVACGAFGSTRLVAGSQDLYGTDLVAGESAQFTIPMLSARPIPDPRTEPRFTLNQFNMIVQLDESGRDLSQIHFYNYNDAFTQALPRVLTTRRAGGLTAQLMRRLSVGIGYLPSWASPKLHLRFAPSGDPSTLPAMSISREPPRWMANKMLRSVLGQLVAAAPLLDLWPLLPQMIIATGAKSYHFGATFPHRSSTGAGVGSDRLGRVGGWQHIHLIDASVFPSVPATTFTLTIMSNAHRIASELLEGAAA
jgi:hypothetical protein